jgi:hypothetical protein
MLPDVPLISNAAACGANGENKAAAAEEKVSGGALEGDCNGIAPTVSGVDSGGDKEIIDDPFDLPLELNESPLPASASHSGGSGTSAPKKPSVSDASAKKEGTVQFALLDDSIQDVSDIGQVEGADVGESPGLMPSHTAHASPGYTDFGVVESFDTSSICNDSLPLSPLCTREEKEEQRQQQAQDSLDDNTRSPSPPVAEAEAIKVTTFAIKPAIEAQSGAALPLAEDLEQTARAKITREVDDRMQQFAVEYKETERKKVIHDIEIQMESLRPGIEQDKRAAIELELDREMRNLKESLERDRKVEVERKAAQCERELFEEKRVQMEREVEKRVQALMPETERKFREIIDADVESRLQPLMAVAERQQKDKYEAKMEAK